MKNSKCITVNSITLIFNKNSYFKAEKVTADDKSVDALNTEHYLKYRQINGGKLLFCLTILAYL